MFLYVWSETAAFNEPDRSSHPRDWKPYPLWSSISGAIWMMFGFGPARLLRPRRRAGSRSLCVRPDHRARARLPAGHPAGTLASRA